MNYITFDIIRINSISVCNSHQLSHYQSTMFAEKTISVITVLISLVQVISTLKRTVDEDKKLQLACPDNKCVKIKDAIWQKKRASIKNMFKIRTNQRKYKQNKQHITYIGKGKWNATQDIQQECSIGYPGCNITPTIQMILDCGYKMFLRVEYECLNCDRAWRLTSIAKNELNWMKNFRTKRGYSPSPRFSLRTNAKFKKQIVNWNKKNSVNSREYYLLFGLS